MYAQLLPPLPTEAQLQASLLHAQPPLPSRAPPGPAVTDALAGAAQAAALAAADVAALLRSWKPGDPLPKGLPPMPPGWKPGDPLPFAAGRAAEPAVRLHAFAACAGCVNSSSDVFRSRLQEDTRYVPRVALEELNPDLDFEVMGEEDYGACLLCFCQVRRLTPALLLIHAAMEDDDDDDDDDDD
jgi:hypothetical protein